MGIIKLFDGYKLPENRLSAKDSHKEISTEVLKELLSYFDFSSEGIQNFILFSKEQELKRKFMKVHKNTFNSLTTKEEQVFKLVVNGKKTAEIAALLFVESSTISTHRKNIKQKLNLTSIFDWYQHAKAFNLLSFELD
jgi:DNA-binding NarL/FixJ family response regulator